MFVLGSMVEFAIVLFMEQTDVRDEYSEPVAPTSDVQGNRIKDTTNFYLGNPRISNMRVRDVRNDAKNGETERNIRRKANFCRTSSLTRKIDYASFILFNAGYLIFNVSYFIYYNYTRDYDRRFA